MEEADYDRAPVAVEIRDAKVASFEGYGTLSDAERQSRNHGSGNDGSRGGKVNHLLRDSPCPFCHRVYSTGRSLATHKSKALRGDVKWCDGKTVKPKP